MPKRIAEAPELFPWLHAEYEAFQELSTCRFDGGVIPWTAIHQYACVYGYDSDSEILQRFIWLIRAMDKVYIEHRAKARLAAQGKPGRK